MGRVEETVRLVEEQDRRIIATQADVRDAGQLRAAPEHGVGELGGLDIVVARAGIAPLGGNPPMQAWNDVIDTNLIGWINAVRAGLRYLTPAARPRGHDRCP
jgi:NAD(P)-dependent dehydrogenase (short-subunit alcohol dehydrogenase family)